MNCHPDRSEPGFSCFAALDTTACAAFGKESRMKFANAINLDRKSGGAKWRDLLFSQPASNADGRFALPLVISTEAQRSGEISVWMLPPGNVFRPERSGVERSAVLLLRQGACEARYPVMATMSSMVSLLTTPFIIGAEGPFLVPL
jgi:hypothetical protein